MNGNSLRYLILLIIFSFNTLFSQNVIKGTILDSHNIPIPFANVLIKHNGKIIASKFSDQVGKFEINTGQFEKINISITSIGYYPFSEEIIFENKFKVLEKIFILQSKDAEIKEVVIKYVKPLTVKKDTIVFDAKSFLQGNEQVVEDLLKKIPGLNVSSDGVIKVGNQEVEKVMIDGDDFFEKGYKILTKNMPVQPVDKVELYEHYSNNKHLKGLENSNKVALNLKLKEDAKQQWFGNMQLGYGLFSENRYETKSNLMNFGKKNKYYFLSNFNNIGEDATGDIDHLIRPFRYNEPSSLGDNESAKKLLNLNVESPNLKPKRINFNNAEMVSLNGIFTASPKLKIKTLAFFNSDENHFYKNSFQSFQVGTTSFQNNEDVYAKKAKVLGFGKFDIIYDISKTKTIEYTTKFTFSDEKNNSDLLFNGNLLNEDLKNNNQLFDQKIVYSSKITKDKVVLFSGRFINEKSPQIYHVNQFLFQDLFSITANNVVQSSENKMQFLGFEGHYMHRKKNGNLVEFQFGNQFRKDDLLTNFKLKNNDTTLEEPIDYQNKIQYSVNDLYINSSYLFKFDKFSLLAKTEFHQLFNELGNLKKQNPFFINPRIGLNWEINNKNKIATSYSFNKSNATILDVYNGYVQSSSRSFSRGTGSFNQLESSAFISSYTHGSWSDKFFVNTVFSYTKNHDFFTSNTNIVQNYSLSDKILIKDRETFNFSNNIDVYVKPISNNVKLTVGGSKSNYKNRVNNSSLREIKSTFLNYGFEVRSAFNGFFNYNFGSKWEINEIKTAISNSYTNNVSFLDLSFVLNEKFNFDIKTEQYYFGNLDKSNNKYYFLDTEARYVVKKNKLTFSLYGNNLLNTKTFRNYNISDIDISKTEYRLQNRYVLLKMDLRF